MEALFGYSYSVERPHFIRNLALDADCTLSNCYQSFSTSFKPYLSQNRFTFNCNSLLEGVIHFKQTPLSEELYYLSVHDREINVFRIL